jgi:hypothetical protein
MTLNWLEEIEVYDFGNSSGSSHRGPYLAGMLDFGRSAAEYSTLRELSEQGSSFANEHYVLLVWRCDRLSKDPWYCWRRVCPGFSHQSWARTTLIRLVSGQRRSLLTDATASLQVLLNALCYTAYQ